jgi:hypothetical protein
MTDLDLNAILATPSQLGRQRRFTADVSETRKTERNRRNAKAQSLAMRAVAKLHKDEYDILYQQAFEQINRERGPLPGDNGDTA